MGNLLQIKIYIQLRKRCARGRERRVGPLYIKLLQMQIQPSYKKILFSFILPGNDKEKFLLILHDTNRATVYVCVYTVWSGVLYIDSQRVNRYMNANII